MFLKVLLLASPPVGTLPAEGVLPPVPPVGAGTPVLLEDAPGALDILVEDPVDALVEDVLLLITRVVPLVVLVRTLERGVVGAIGLSGHGVVRAELDVLGWDGTDEGGGA